MPDTKENMNKVERFERLGQANMAGRLFDNVGLSDSELELAIFWTESCLHYLEGRGPVFDLATNQIRLDLDCLNGYLRERRIKFV